MQTLTHLLADAVTIKIDSGWAGLIVMLLAGILGWLIRAEIRFSKGDARMKAIEQKDLENDKKVDRAMEQLNALTTGQAVMGKDIEHIKGGIDDQKQLTHQVIQSLREIRSVRIREATEL